mmetsp:Transcript_20749/g.45616  ORF Transcript_20749/g.45616 Transcript_20749/m.45616 type:complete len:647 (-) Transcript_20749:171-2111(-)
MGQGLPKAVTSVVVKRRGGSHFRVGLAEMNGWRLTMEDAHVIYMKDSWAFFGVLDGHGGDQCSNFIATRLMQELPNGAPANEDATKSLMLRLDKEFLSKGQPSGSTGTFVHILPSQDDQKGYQLRVSNIGDSRVLLGRADGTIVEGPGTDGGLTTDHKPDHPDERERIVRTGGHVQDVMGVARVNGDLAVSRAFGDSPYKKTGGPRQEDHPVSAAPEMGVFTCGPTDFIMLVCDGISEGNFPNREVVQLAAEELRSSDGRPSDPGRAAAAVCRMALQRNSQDNLSCMIVLLGGGEAAGPEEELQPGPFDAPRHQGFRRAYAAMAGHVGLSLPEAVEKRYDIACKERSDLLSQKSGVDVSGDAGEGAGAGGDNGAGEEREAALAVLQNEIEQFGDGPPDELVSGSPDRVHWFSTWLAEHIGAEDSDDPRSMSREQLMATLAGNPRLMAYAREQGLVGDMEEDGPRRMVRVAPIAQLRKAVEANRSLKWAAPLAKASGKIGLVLEDDDSDGTSKVKFSPPVSFTAWLPTCILTDVENGRKVSVGPSVDELREAIDSHPALTWNERLVEVCGQSGNVIQDDEADGTSQVQFAPPITITAWLPTKSLKNSDEEENTEYELDVTDRQVSTEGETNGSEESPSTNPKRKRVN